MEEKFYWHANVFAEHSFMYNRLTCYTYSTFGVFPFFLAEPRLNTLVPAAGASAAAAACVARAARRWDAADATRRRSVCTTPAMTAQRSVTASAFPMAVSPPT